MSMKILAGLEKLEDEIEETEETKDTISYNDAIDLIVLEDEIKEDSDEISKENNILDEAEASVETLLHIHTMIEKYGVSLPMMEMADPNRELVDAGIVPSYESFNEFSIDNDDSAAALEGILDTVKKSLGKMFDGLKYYLNKIKLVVEKIFAGFRKQYKVIESLIKKFSNVKEFNKERMKKSKFKVEQILEDPIKAIKFIGNVGVNNIIGKIDKAANAVVKYAKSVNDKDFEVKRPKEMMDVLNEIKKHDKEFRQITGRFVQEKYGDIETTISYGVRIKILHNEIRKKPFIDTQFNNPSNVVKILKELNANTKIQNDIISKYKTIFEISINLNNFDFIKTFAHINPKRIIRANKGLTMAIHDLRALLNIIYDIIRIVADIYIKTIKTVISTKAFIVKK